MTDASPVTPFVSSGLDVVAIDRFESLRAEFGESFTRRLFTDAERAYCEGTRVPSEHYAARWAAKESFRKALSAPVEMPPFDEVAVERTGDGPELRLGESATTALADSLRANSVAPERASVSVSLSHDRASGIASAHVTVLGLQRDA